jgi:O-antigen/teichoic acid export membrane protein
MSRKQVGINMIANIVAFLVSFAINFFLTPYMIKVLGKEAYGFYPLANSFQNYYAILVVALNSMVLRYITISYYEDDKEQINKYFSSVLFSNIAFSAVLSAAFAVLIVYINKIFNVPAYLLGDVRALFAFSSVSFMIALVFSVYGAATYTKNKLSYRSFLTIGEAFLRAIVIVITFVFLTPRISYLGLSMLLNAILVAVVTFIFTKKLLPEVKVSIKYFDKKSIIALLASGVWNAVNRLGDLLLTGLNMAIANIFLGASAAGQYGIVLTVPNLLRGLIPVISAAFGAQITIWYAKKRMDMVISEVIYASKSVSLILSIPLSIILIYGDVFFKLWVPTEDARFLQILSVLSLVPLFVSINIEGLQYVFQTANKLKIPSLVTLGMAAASVSLELIFVKIIGIYAIPLASSLALSAYLLLFVPIYAAKVLSVKVKVFYISIFRGFFGVAVFSLFLLATRCFISVNSWFIFLFAMGLFGFIGLAINFFIIVNKENRAKLFSALKGKIPLLK